MNGHTLVIPISQSGETADTLAALRLAKKNGKRTLAIVNAVGSTAAVEADYVLYQCAGPEIAVATTKGYTTQAVLLAMTAIKLGVLRGRLGTERGRALASALVSDLPHAIESILSRDSELSEIARLLRDQSDAYFIGRGPDFPACTECSLKLKEISYIHSEAYAAGELKHGTLSLIERGTILAALATDPLYHAKTAGNIAEVRARGGYTVLFCTPDFENASDTADTVFTLPPLPPGARLHFGGNSRTAYRAAHGTAARLRCRSSPQPCKIGHGRITRVSVYVTVEYYGTVFGHAKTKHRAAAKRTSGQIAVK